MSHPRYLTSEQFEMFHWVADRLDESGTVSRNWAVGEFTSRGWSEELALECFRLAIDLLREPYGLELESVPDVEYAWPDDGATGG